MSYIIGKVFLHKIILFYIKVTLKIHVFGILVCMTETDNLEFNVQQINFQYFPTMNIYHFRHLLRTTKGCVHYHNFISIFILLRLTYTIVTTVRSTQIPKTRMTAPRATRTTNYYNKQYAKLMYYFFVLHLVVEVLDTQDRIKLNVLL